MLYFLLKILSASLLKNKKKTHTSEKRKERERKREERGSGRKETERATLVKAYHTNIFLNMVVFNIH